MEDAKKGVATPEVKAGKARALRRSFAKLSEYEAAAAEATVASSHWQEQDAGR